MSDKEQDIKADKSATATNKTTAAKKPATRSKAAQKKTATKPAVAKTSAAKPAAKKTASAKTAAKKPAPKRASTKAGDTASASAAKATKPASKSSKSTSSSEKPSSDTSKTEGRDNDSKAEEFRQESSADTAKIVEDLKGRDWPKIIQRALLMFFFGVLGTFALYLSFVLAVAQIGFMIFAGSANEALARIIRQCGMYIRDVLDYLSFASDECPFPFGRDLPDAN